MYVIVHINRPCPKKSYARASGKHISCAQELVSAMVCSPPLRSSGAASLRALLSLPPLG